MSLSQTKLTPQLPRDCKFSRPTFFLNPGNGQSPFIISHGLVEVKHCSEYRQCGWDLESITVDRVVLNLLRVHGKVTQVRMIGKQAFGKKKTFYQQVPVNLPLSSIQK